MSPVDSLHLRMSLNKNRRCFTVLNISPNRYLQLLCGFKVCRHPTSLVRPQRNSSGVEMKVTSAEVSPVTGSWASAAVGEPWLWGPQKGYPRDLSPRKSLTALISGALQTSEGPPKGEGWLRDTSSHGTHIPILNAFLQLNKQVLSPSPFLAKVLRGQKGQVITTFLSHL